MSQSDATTTEHEIETKPFHEWMLQRLGEMGTSGPFSRMLFEITIPAKHDEIIVAWMKVVSQVGIDDATARAVVTKLETEKTKQKAVHPVDMREGATIEETTIVRQITDESCGIER